MLELLVVDWKVATPATLDFASAPRFASSTAVAVRPLLRKEYSERARSNRYNERARSEVRARPPDQAALLGPIAQMMM